MEAPVRPGASRGTTRADSPRVPPSAPVRANTTYIPAAGAFEMKRLAPVMTQWSPCRSARVATAAASEPASGSVSAKAGTVSPRASAGSQRCFWASVPARRMG